MKHIRKSLPVAIISAVVGVIIGTFFTVSAQDQKVFELRTYQATPGNLDNLHARFRDHTIRIFRKHGMEIVGFWSPTSEDERDDILVYLLAHDSQEAADASWQAFGADPEWDRVAEESNRNGQILAGVERKYMIATDYSPMK
ncbi:MAG: NIPSNAP family protein [Pseudohongiellaceae bacterium]